MTPEKQHPDHCQYLGQWELIDGRAVYEPCRKCGQSIDAPIHNSGES